MPKLRLFVIPHTHYDAEVFLTRDVTLKWGSDNLLDVLYLLDRDPDYRFTLDQRCYVEGFESLFPEQMERLRTHVMSGRLELAGKMHVMPDENIPSGESLVRQITYGSAYFDQFPVRQDNGWMLDTFGHHPQMPQIMLKGGLNTYCIQRGVADPAHPAGFWWVGIDGSRIRAEWMPQTYAIISIIPETFPAFEQMVNHIIPLIQPYVYNNQFAVLSGQDISAPIQHLPEMMRRFNAKHDDVELVMANMQDYFAAQSTDNFIENHDDLNPLFTGCYAARIALKQENRRLENTLLTAEKLIAINHIVQGQPVDTLGTCWEPVLFNQFHDVICGSHIDEIYERALSRYQQVTTALGTITEQNLAALTSQIDTQGNGMPLVVFNFLGHARQDAARCTVGLTESWEWLALYDDQGNRVPLQLDDVQRHPDGSIKRADLLFIADVPALGYRTYFVREGQDTLQPTDLWIDGVFQWAGMPSVIAGQLRPDVGRMGNSLIDIHINMRTGAIQEIRLREADWNIVDTNSDFGFASVCRQEDQGDPWEYYGPLRGAATATLPFVDPVPPRGRATYSDEYGGAGQAISGPVMTELRLTHPFNDGKFGIRVRLYAGLPRVEIETHLVNEQEFRRYRNVFPLNLDSPQITYEIPFGALQRPEGEYPAQNWVDVADGDRGVTLLNRGIPGHSLVGNTLTTSLMKCIKVVDYHGGGYSQRTKDVGGFELGVPHHYEQALIPHTGTWQEKHVTQAGMAFNSPLAVRKVTPHTGTLPTSGSFVAIEPANIVLHAFYIENETLIVRAAESEGQDVSGQVTLRWPIAQVEEADFIGNVSATLTPNGSTFTFNAQPFEIKTFRVKLA